MNVICPYCSQPARFISGKDLLPKFPKLWNDHFWACIPCGANVKAHRNSGRPMGMIADSSVRYARGEAHKAIDRLWRNPQQAGYVTPTWQDVLTGQRAMRRRVYLWIAEVCLMTEEEAHIGMISDIPLLEAIRDMAREMDPATLRSRYPAIPSRRFRRAA